VPPERFLVEVPAEAAIEFDPGHLHQVIWNLLTNAVRYARAEPAAIRLSARTAGDRVELSVVDNGPGVPPSSLGQLFEPFFTTDSLGTGLGLYLARELCAANRAVLEHVREASGAHFRVVARSPARP
jgi:two-component system, NtrC family, sensor histidine kinase PilS